MSISFTGTKTVASALNNLSQSLPSIATTAVKKSVTKLKQVTMSFDDVESSPYITGNSGSVVLTGNFDSSPTALPILAEQLTSTTANTLTESIEEQLKGVLK